MESKRFKPALLVPSTALLLLLLGTNTLAIAPGDESGECAVPDYPVNIKVLLDSWRYQTLLPQDDATNSAAMWTTDESDSTWYSTGMCENSAVTVCAGGPEEWLQTQHINKSVPAPDNYTVRVFVNITYSFMTCPEGRDCDHDFELLIARNFSQYTGDSNMPDRHIRDTTANGTQHFYFNVGVDEDVFDLALKSRRKGVCVNVSRVLVYRHECPGHEQQRTGLTRNPATQAPVNDNVSAIPYCVENSHPTYMPQQLICTAEGEWMNGNLHCECDLGYYKDGYVCKALAIAPEMTQITVTTGSLTPADLATNRLTSVTQTPGPVVTGSIIPADIATDRLTQTPVIKASITPTPPTDMSDTESSSEDGGVSTAVFAGVGGMVVVIIALILLVILLIVILVRKNRNHKDNSIKNDRQMANPVYGAAVEIKTNCTTANGNADTHTQSSPQFENPLYTTPLSLDSKSNDNSHLFYEDPQYSVPVHVDSRVPITEYEVPNGSDQPPAHVYDYAAVPHSTPPEYAVLEPQEHAYHCLEPPKMSVAIPESNEMAAESDVPGNHYDQPLGQNHEYSTLQH